MDSLHKNFAWELVNLLKGKKAMRCNTCSLKDDPFLHGIRYKARLFAKDCA